MYFIGEIALPVPPRSAQSLNITKSTNEPMYITPNEVPRRKRSGEFTHTIHEHTYKSFQDWWSRSVCVKSTYHARTAI